MTTYGQRQRAAERKLARAYAKARERYSSLSTEERAAFDDKARRLRGKLLPQGGASAREKP